MLTSHARGRTTESRGKCADVNGVGRDSGEGISIYWTMVDAQDSGVQIKERIGSGIRAAFDHILSQNNISPGGCQETA